jgi:hypothetical protein
MISKRWLLIVGLMIATGSAGGWPAQVHSAVADGSDILGLATTSDANGEFALYDPELGAFDLQLVVYGFDHAQGIAGWECQVVLPAGVQATGITLNGKADPAGVDLTTGNMRVFPLIPVVPLNGIVHLATLHLTLTEFEDDQDFLLAPYLPAAPSSTMGYSLETSGANVFDFHWPGECSDCPVFQIIASPKPTVKTSWSVVKSLYR